jgi:hypothetical protein
MANNHAEEAARLGFDLTKQFITLAVGGIAFVVGLSFSTPTVVSSLLLWSTIGVFAVSAVLGLFFLMHGVNILSVQKSYDIYATSLRFLAGLQIVLVLVGMVLLCPILYQRPATPATRKENSIHVQLSPQQSISYPVEADKSYTVEIENGKVTFSALKR